MQTKILLCSTICAMIFCTCESLPLLDEEPTIGEFNGFHAEENKSMMRYCRKFNDKILRRACRSMSVNPLFALVISPWDVDADNFEKINLGPLKHIKQSPIEKIPQSGLVYDQPEEESVSVDWNSLTTIHKVQDPCSITSSTGQLQHERSISPWEYYIDYNILRFPPRISFAQCLCSGCIDISTGQENLNLSSEPLTIHESVIMRKSSNIAFSECNSEMCELKKIEVPVGCHCTRIISINT